MPSGKLKHKCVQFDPVWISTRELGVYDFRWKCIECGQLYTPNWKKDNTQKIKEE